MRTSRSLIAPDRRRSVVTLLLAAVLSLAVLPTPAGAAPVADDLDVSLLASGLQVSIGSTIGPDGALYVPEGAAGRIARVDRETGEVTTFASGLPRALLSFGGPMDIAFRGRTAYVLVSLVGSDLGGSDAVGIYRIDGPSDATLVADIGAFSLANPPEPAFFIPTGVQYALERYRDGFLVSDGHHNRVLEVSHRGDIRELQTFDDVVPTGMAISRSHTVHLALAGPIPHVPEDGRAVAFRHDGAVEERAAGAKLLVDVEVTRGCDLYGLSQGDFPDGAPDGSPALPDTGALVRADGDGGFDVLVSELDRPTSMEVVGETAYVVTLTGEVWQVDGLDGARHRGRC